MLFYFDLWHRVRGFLYFYAFLIKPAADNHPLQMYRHQPKLAAAPVLNSIVNKERFPSLCIHYIS